MIPKLPMHLQRKEIWQITFILLKPLWLSAERRMTKKIKVKTFGDDRDEAVQHAREAAEAQFGITLPDQVMYDAKKEVRWLAGRIRR